MKRSLLACALLSGILGGSAGAEIRWKKVAPKSPATAMVGTNQGLFVGSDSGEIVFLADDGSGELVTAKLESPITKINASADGTWIGAFGQDGGVRLIQHGKTEPIKLPGKMTETPWDLVIPSSPKAGTLEQPVIGLGDGGTWFSWTDKGVTSQDLKLEQPLALSPSGSYAAGWRDGAGLLVVDGITGKVMQTLQNEENRPSAVSFSPSTRLVAVALGGDAGQIILWDLRDAVLRRRLPFAGAAPTKLLFDPDETKLTCVRPKGDVFEIDLTNGDTRSVAESSLPDVTSEILKKHTVLSSVNLCSIDNKGNLIIPDPETRTFSAAAPAAPFVHVPVFVATNRQRSVEPTFLKSVGMFFAGITGLVALGIAVLSILIAAFAGGRQAVWRTSGVALAVLLILASSDAFGTVRRFDPATKDVFGSTVGDMSYGRCDVTIPTSNRTRGEMNAPFRFLSFEFAADPEYHIILKSTDLKSEGDYFDLVKSRVSESAGKDALVFIHGFNVTFEEAVRRTAQLAYDLEFGGAPICFTWPSYGAEALYPYDARNAEASVPQLQAFMKNVAVRSGASRIHVIAHSMGNRVLSQAIELEPDIFSGNDNLFKNLIFAAPDVDKQLFLTRIAPKLEKCAAHKTLYGSSHDRALALSKRFNGEPRAGDTRPTITFCSGVDSIDCSDVDLSSLGHGYICEEPTVLSDVFYLMNDRLPHQRFGIMRVAEGQNVYWRIRR